MSPEAVAEQLSEHKASIAAHEERLKTAEQLGREVRDAITSLRNWIIATLGSLVIGLVTILLRAR